LSITHISLTLLIFSIIYFLSWLLIKTLKEGREALKEIKKMPNKNSSDPIEH